jgi:anti-anti-sigma regulatory factor
MGSGKPAIVRQLPERFVKGQLEQFSREVQAQLRVERPRLVFDFSAVQEIDRFAAQLLLDFLKQALKANGDIKLASLPALAELILELTGVDRVFEAYPNVFEAVESFQQCAPESYVVDEFWPAQPADMAQFRLRIAN